MSTHVLRRRLDRANNAVHEMRVVCIALMRMLQQTPAIQNDPVASANLGKRICELEAKRDEEF